MSLAALDRLDAAQARLTAALDAADPGEIAAASQALAHAAEQVGAVAGWRATPALRERLTAALKAGDAARIRTGTLADHNRCRLQALLAIGGRAPLAYGRNGKVRLPGA